MEHKRYQAIEELVSNLHGWLDKFRGNSYTCSQGNHYNLACSSMLLGALTKEMDRVGCWFPRPEVPFQPFSFNEWYGNMAALQAPTWFGLSRDRYQHSCGFSNTVEKDAGRITAKLNGLNLLDFVDRGDK
jgi:hypothetical protein